MHRRGAPGNIGADNVASLGALGNSGDRGADGVVALPLGPSLGAGADADALGSDASNCRI